MNPTKYMLIASEIIKRFEGCSLVAYKDIVGIWTIGYGRTEGVKEGDVCTGEQADHWLTEEIFKIYQALDNRIKPILTDNQLAAIISLAYNVGTNAVLKSTLLKKINDPQFVLKKEFMLSTADQFLRWNKAGGKVVKGLTNRRTAERELFIK